MPTITTQATVKCLKVIFAQFDIPERIVSDNGPPLLAGNLRTSVDRMGLNI